MNNKVSTKTNYYAISKDGTFKQKLADLNEAQAVKTKGKYRFQIAYVEGVRKIEDIDLDCDVYEEEVVTSKTYKKL